MASLAWLPLEGASADAITLQHRDPLKAIEQGIIPAIVIRGLLRYAEARDLVDRLLHLRAAGLAPNACNEQWQASRSWMEVAPTYWTLGPDLSNCLLKGSTIAMERRARWFEHVVSANNLTQAVHAARSALHTLAAGRRLRRALDDTSGRPLLPAMFRVHRAGNRFPLHFDTLHTSDWDRRACGTAGRIRGERNLSHSALSEPRRTGELAARYPDVLRYRSQLAAILVLQPAHDDTTHGASKRAEAPAAAVNALAGSRLHRLGERRARAAAAAEVSVHEPHWASLVDDCSVAGASHSGGVHLRGYPQSGRAASARRAQISLDAGDLYVFHSNRLHEVHEVHGEMERVTLAIAAGLSESDVALWA